MKQGMRSVRDSVRVDDRIKAYVIAYGRRVQREMKENRYMYMQVLSRSPLPPSFDGLIPGSVGFLVLVLVLVLVPLNLFSCTPLLMYSPSPLLLYSCSHVLMLSIQLFTHYI